MNFFKRWFKKAGPEVELKEELKEPKKLNIEIDPRHWESDDNDWILLQFAVLRYGVSCARHIGAITDEFADRHLYVGTTTNNSSDRVHFVYGDDLHREIAFSFKNMTFYDHSKHHVTEESRRTSGRLVVRQWLVRELGSLRPTELLCDWLEFVDNHSSMQLARDTDSIIEDLRHFTISGIAGQAWFGRCIAKEIFPNVIRISDKVASVIAREVYYSCADMQVDSKHLVDHDLQLTQNQTNGLNLTVAGRYWLDLTFDEAISTYPNVIRYIAERLPLPVEIFDKKIVSFFPEECFSRVKGPDGKDVTTNVLFGRRVSACNERLVSTAYLTLIRSDGYFAWVRLDIPTWVDALDPNDYIKKGEPFDALVLASKIEDNFKEQ